MDADIYKQCKDADIDGQMEGAPMDAGTDKEREGAQVDADIDEE